MFIKPSLVRQRQADLFCSRTAGLHCEFQASLEHSEILFFKKKYKNKQYQNVNTNATLTVPYNRKARDNSNFALISMEYCGTKTGHGYDKGSTLWTNFSDEH